MSREIADQLCDHIDLLRKQHKAGLTPSFGQIDDLFELSDQLRAAARASATPAALVCSVRGCLQDAGALVAGKPYCRVHGRQVGEVLSSLQELMPDVYASVGRVEWPTTRPSLAVVNGPDPRD